VSPMHASMIPVTGCPRVTGFGIPKPVRWMTGIGPVSDSVISRAWKARVRATEPPSPPDAIGV